MAGGPAEAVPHVGAEGAGLRDVAAHRGIADGEQQQDRAARDEGGGEGGPVAERDAQRDGAADDGERGGGGHHHEDDGTGAEGAGRGGRRALVGHGGHRTSMS